MYVLRNNYNAPQQILTLIMLCIFVVACGIAIRGDLNLQNINYKI
jgi:hypothetical protein